MGIFSPTFQNEGPGISKNQSIKYGPILFFQLLIEKFWILIKLNLIFIVSCIPIFTIPASIAAMTYITMNLIQRNHVFLINDFIRKFKENFRQSTLCFIITFSLGFFILFSLSFYYSLGAQNYIFLILFFIFIPISIIYSMSLIYLYPLLTTINLTSKDIIKNSLFLSITCIKNSIYGLLLIGLVFLVSILLFPISLLFLLLLCFSLISFISSFISYPNINRYVAIKQ